MSTRCVISVAWRRIALLLCFALGSVISTGCKSPNAEIVRFDGGSVGGPLFRGPNRFTAVGLERLDGDMAARTTIRLADGVPVRVTQATPEFLLARGLIFAQDAAGTPIGDPIPGVTRFDRDKNYVVIIGPEPNGPFYRFDVHDGKAVRFGAEWLGGFLSDGVTLRPAPVFVDGAGAAHEMPFNIDTVKMIWGEPESVEQVQVGG